jgi:hypothetical protein
VRCFRRAAFDKIGTCIQELETRVLVFASSLLLQNKKSVASRDPGHTRTFTGHSDLSAVRTASEWYCSRVSSGWRKVQQTPPQLPTPNAQNISKTKLPTPGHSKARSPRTGQQLPALHASVRAGRGKTYLSNQTLLASFHPCSPFAFKRTTIKPPQRHARVWCLDMPQPLQRA